MALTIISLRQIVCPGMTVEANQTEQQDGLLLENRCATAQSDDFRRYNAQCYLQLETCVWCGCSVVKVQTRGH